MGRTHFLERLLTELARHEVGADVELTSPHLPLLGMVKAVKPELRTGMFVAAFPPWLPSGVGRQQVCDYLTLLDAQVAHLPASLLEPTFVERLHLGGWLVHSADINTEADMARAMQLGVDQLSTDHLELALHFRNAFFGNHIASLAGRDE